MAELTKTQERKKAELEALIPKRKELTLFQYQEECLNAIKMQPEGSRSLVVMATGLGKTGTFTHIPTDGRVLIVSKGTEIVLNPLQYYPKDFPVGLEMDTFHAQRDFPDVQVVSASIDSIADRLEDYDPKHFRTIIIDEAHHSTAPTYKAVIDYFKPEHLIGFTATPNRSDGVRLDTVYNNIIFERDLRWAIQNEKLCDIVLQKVALENVDLRNVRAVKSDNSVVADFAQVELEKAMAKCAPVVARIYKEYAFGPTVINVAGVRIAYEVADLITGAVAVTGQMSMSERNMILEAFREGKIPCLVNVDVLKEGVDLPNIQTIIMCRPTLSSLLYTQQVGRGLRLYPGKKYLNLIECEGIMGDNVTLCSAPCLFGIDLSLIPKDQQRRFNNKSLSEISRIVQVIMDEPKNWLFSSRNSQIWADTNGYDIHDVNWLLMPDGHLELTFPKRLVKKGEHTEGEKKRYSNEQYRMVVPAPDTLGRVVIGHTRMPLQIALDLAREELDRNYGEQAILWDKVKIKRWANKPVTENQKKLIKSVIPDTNFTDMTSFQASTLISKIKRQSNTESEEKICKIYPVDPDSPPPHFKSTERSSLDKKPFLIYDYDPGKEYVLDAKRERLIREFTTWVVEKIWLTYEQCNKNIEALIKILNRVRRDKDMAKPFITQVEPKYKYLCALNGSPVSRSELIKILAERADTIIPAIIQARIIEGKENLAAIVRTKPDIEQAPLNALKYQFPTTREKLLRKFHTVNKLPKTASELKEADKERWLKQQQKKNAKTIKSQ